MKTCLVLGAGGFIGKNLCIKLSSKYKVIAYDRYICEELEGLTNIICKTGDFVKTTDFSPLLEEVSIIYHLIGTTLPQKGTKHIISELNQNLLPTIHLLEAIKEAGIKRMIFASSGGTVYGEHEGECHVEDVLHPKCSYGVLKRVIEDYLDFYNTYSGLSCISARIGNPYGMGQDIRKPQGVIPIFIRNLLKGNPITIWGDGNTKRDYIYLDDLSNALALLAEYSGNITTFNIGSGTGYSLNEIIYLIEKISGRIFSKIEYLPGRDFDVKENILNIEETKSELNWKCNKKLHDGINEILERYLSGYTEN